MVVYAALAAVVVLVYLVVVVGGGRLLGAEQPDRAFALLATVGVALAFQPLKPWLRTVADGLVYGRTASAHDVLSAVARHLTATDVDVLGRIVGSLVDGTSATAASISVAVDGRLVPVAHTPGFDASGKQTVVRVEHDGDLLGQLSLQGEPHTHLDTEDLALARRVADALGVALRHRLLHDVLRGRVAELRESRRRVVDARHAARRRLERDLHDGAQPQLVAVRFKVGVARAAAEGENDHATCALLDRVAASADDVVGKLRDFARAVYPPSLATDGLVAAVRAEARRLSLPVVVRSGSVSRLDERVEATVFFCIAGLLKVGRDHGAGARTVVVDDGPAGVEFEVHQPWRRGQARSGAPGLVDVRDRVNAAGGSFRIGADAPGRAVFSGSVPRGGLC